MLMQLFKYISILSLAAIFLACTTTVAQKGKQPKFEDDLSNFRPSYKLEEKVNEELSEKELDTIIPSGHVNKDIEAYLDTITYPTTVKGYRIQIYSGNSSEKANNAYGASLSLFPEWCVYQHFTISHVVKVGDFKDRVQAYEAYMRLKQHFPTALLVTERVKINCDNE